MATYASIKYNFGTQLTGEIPTAAIADDAVTLAKMAGGTDGNIISFDASGDPVAIATGDDGQVLTSTGAGSPPAFEAAAGGGAWNLIGTSVASDSASLTITGLDSTYDCYAIVCSDLVPATDGANWEFRLGDSSGVDSGGSDYSYHLQDATPASSGYGTSAVSAGADSMILANALGSGAGEGMSGTFWLGRPGDATGRATIIGLALSNTTDSTCRGGTMFGQRLAVITVDRVYGAMTSGNTATGRMSIYGISHT